MDNKGCSMPLAIAFSALMAASFLYTGYLYENTVLIVFGYIQAAVTVAGIAALIIRKTKGEP
ncbi:MAG TPA: hypothetical protein PKV16_03735 [Caldisericia bacterium]|nr:hypothetical protein [Caldisericia bacterium]HPF48422.1 hypothetical protein [Caldisericia bacterium]HPI83398.1 hypothetical protein [Caldisericia bacterium]HPQ92876.1 hypothetical protein [Caldisericia bacterium]HRV74026.1 hypothetical protein [Caldisericia bacterium]